MVTKPKVLILGHGAHGKDTVADIVTDFTGLRFESSSMAAAAQAVLPSMPQYASAQECFDDRRNHRQQWRELISAYNTPDKGRLCKEILQRCDGYVGMRCHLEYASVRHLFDHVLWVDASKRVQPDPSMTIDRDVDMVFIDNNGDIDDTAENVLAWAQQAGLCY
jgi:hypothetical protein